MERFKEILVAKGYNQQKGLDYHYTFSPIAKMVTVRCVITLAILKWCMYQMDFYNALFLGDLDDELYMERPYDCKEKRQNKVHRLVKSLYGLK